MVFEIDRFKVIGCVARNCETKEEYDEIMKIIESTDEVVRNDKEIEKTNCVLILDQLLRDNENLVLRKRLESKDETPNNGEGDGENDGDRLSANTSSSRYWRIVVVFSGSAGPPAHGESLNGWPEWYAFFANSLRSAENKPIGRWAG